MAGLTEYVDELTKCPICLDDVTDPKSLPCLHTFCLICIRGHCKDVTPGKQLNCPICRTVFTLPEHGVDQLQNNFFIKGLADIKKVSSKPSATCIVPCEVCSEDPEMEAIDIPAATMYCTCCGQKLCSRCSKPHQKFPGGAHQMTAFGSATLPQLLKSQGSFCTTHEGNRLELYCMDCCVNICLVCHISKHKKHNCQDIKDVCTDIVRTMQHDLEEVLTRETSILQQVSVMDSKQKQFVDIADEIAKELLVNYNEIKHQVEESFNQLTQELSSKKLEAVKAASVAKSELEFTLAAMQSFTRYTRELVTNGKPSDLTQSYQEVHTRAGALLEQQVSQVDCDLPELLVKPCDLYTNISAFLLAFSTGKESSLASYNRMSASKDSLKDGGLTSGVETIENSDCLKTLKAQYETRVKNIEQERDELAVKLTKLSSDHESLLKRMERLDNEHRFDVKTAKTRVASMHKLELVTSFSEDGEVRGVARLNNELYVRYDREGSVFASTFITVYEIDDKNNSYNKIRSLRVPGLNGVFDMTSCSKYNCIYITDDLDHVVHRIENKTNISQWPVGDNPKCLSVNSSYNVLVTCPDVCKIKEFTTHGHCLRVINLQRDIVHPWHAVELTRDQLVVCHGIKNSRLHRVCIVDNGGKVIKSFGGERGSGKWRIDTPTSLAVNGFIFVADLNNDRVLMFNPDLSFVRTVVSDNATIVCFDEFSGLLYCANNVDDDGLVNVYRCYAGS